MRDLKRALAKLSEEMRTVVLLIGQEGMSCHDAAAVLKVPVGHHALAVVKRPVGIE